MPCLGAQAGGGGYKPTMQCNAMHNIKSDMLLLDSNPGLKLECYTLVVYALQAYPSLKPLASWVTDLVTRMSFINDWIDNGIPTVCSQHSQHMLNDGRSYIEYRVLDMYLQVLYHLSHKQRVVKESKVECL